MTDYHDSILSGDSVYRVTLLECIVIDLNLALSFGCSLCIPVEEMKRLDKAKL